MSINARMSIGSTVALLVDHWNTVQFIAMESRCDTKHSSFFSTASHHHRHCNALRQGI